MPLNSVEQLKLMREGFTNLSEPLDNVIFQEALNTCVQFVETEKDTSPGGELNQLAQNYLLKMKRVVRMVQEGNRAITSRLTQVMISRVGLAVAQDFATVQGAPEAAILSFFSTNMMAVLEGFSGAEVDEKAAYDAL